MNRRIAPGNAVEVAYVVSSISFVCICGTSLVLERWNALVSGVFCACCGQHWYINWRKMVLHLFEEGV